MKRTSTVLIAAAAMFTMPMIAAAEQTPGNVQISARVLPSCAITGDWRKTGGTPSSVQIVSNGKAGAALTWSTSTLVDGGAKSVIKNDAGATVSAPILCNRPFTWSISAAKGALRQNSYGPTAWSGTGFASEWGYRLRANVTALDSDIGLSIGFLSTPLNVNSPAGSTGGVKGVRSVTGIGYALANYAVIEVNLLPNTVGASEPRMVAGNYSETLTLTLTPQ